MTKTVSRFYEKDELFTTVDARYNREVPSLNITPSSRRSKANHIDHARGHWM